LYPQELWKCQQRLSDQFQELSLQQNVQFEELKVFYEQKLFTQEMVSQQKLTETISELHERHSQHILRLQQENDSNLLIERSRAEITEQKLKEFYNKRNENMNTATATIQQTFEKKIQRYEIMIERYQNEIQIQNKKFEEWTEEREKAEKKIAKYQRELKVAEMEKMNLESEVVTAQELSALIVTLYRNGRVRTSDDYNSEELYGYLMRSRSERRGEGRGDEENREMNGVGGGESDEERKQRQRKRESEEPQDEMIVSSATLKKVYEMSKVSSQSPLCAFLPLIPFSES
jgi:hypothetical protein